MPDFNFKPGDGAGTTTLGIIITVWVLLAMSGCLIFQAYTHQNDYQVPPFLVEVFVRLCEIAVGATTLGAGIGVAIHATNKQIEQAKSGPPKIEPKD